MTVRLELKPEVEASLAAHAQARGVPLETYIQTLIEEHARAEPACAATIEQHRAALDALEEMGRDLSPLPLSALSRESMYADHG